MKIAVRHWAKSPFSIRCYADIVTSLLAELGVAIIPLGLHEPIPSGADLCWDPTIAGGNAPIWNLLDANCPVILTVHGAGPMSLPTLEYFPTALRAARGIVRNALNRYKWQRIKKHVSHVITVSQYAKRELVHTLNLPPEKITPIYHAADTALFRARPASSGREPYLLHVSQYQPKKNIERLLTAYARYKGPTKPRLIAIVPGFPEMKVPEGVEIIRAPMCHAELAQWYAEAWAFLFPSLHETFGMPIIEAMASGCPVITSRETACGEIAGNAAIVVNPRSIDDITNALRQLIENDAMRQELIIKGLARAQQFSWQKSAQEHLAVFESVLRKGANQ